MGIYEELQTRGLIAQITDEEKIRNLINHGQATFYIGFDPTADSLHVGHFMALCLMKRLQQAGNKPVVLLGGGTAMIGDPSGKNDMRKMIAIDAIQKNIDCFKKQIGRFIDFSNDKAILVNNADWLLDLNYVDLLREVGLFFPVNVMARAECYKQRMASEGGLSFLEFNYMIMQAYDFYVLYKKYGCNLQFGGDDQWSNMLAGRELIRRKYGLNEKDAFAQAMTITLLLTSEGKKMGKTQSGAIWLDPDKTSPSEFYQYWRNVENADVFKCLRLLTFLPVEEISEMEKHSELNPAKQLLACELTALVHGEEEAKRVEVNKPSFHSKSPVLSDMTIRDSTEKRNYRDKKPETAVLGAIIGDIIGSTYEFSRVKNKDFELFPKGSEFTDDSIMTVAVCDAIIDWVEHGGDLKQLVISSMKKYGRRYPFPKGGYGSRLAKWLVRNGNWPYKSCGNGSAMRVSPCAIVASTLDETLKLAMQSAEVTHNHPEGIKGAQATAAAIFLAKNGASKEEIREYICENFYILNKTLNEIRPNYRFNGTCQGSVPESIQAFLESANFEDAIRNVISLGGDADTMGAITGSIAWAYYGRNGITDDMYTIWHQAERFIPKDLVDRVVAFEASCLKRSTAK